MILCPICKNNFKNRRVFGLHLATTHRTNFQTDLDKEILLVYTLFGEDTVKQVTNDYINEKYCINTLPIDITKFLLLSGLKRTSKEERATSRYKNTYLNGIKEKYGDNITNISQVKEIQKKTKETYAKRYGSYEDYLKLQRSHMLDGYKKYIGTNKHEEAIDKQRNTCLEKYGNGNFGCGKEAKNKSKQSKKQLIDSWDYEERLERTKEARKAVTQRGGYSSKPEKRIRKILIDLDIEASYNQFLWKYSWDLVFDTIIIEVQGTFWHAKPDRYNPEDLIMGKILAKDIWEKDNKKQKKAKEEGYNVIEIWEDEINDRSDEELQLLIKERLTENGYKFYD
jgi:G:T-mismatch repair DNA endonuclease (very short patch repair protein)